MVTSLFTRLFALALVVISHHTTSSLGKTYYSNSFEQTSNIDIPLKVISPSIFDPLLKFFMLKPENPQLFQAVQCKTAQRQQIPDPKIRKDHF